ncbi:MAG: fumarylacetoacetate hydrolase family protein [Polyangiales bacterium]
MHRPQLRAHAAENRKRGAERAADLPQAAQRARGADQAIEACRPRASGSSTKARLTLVIGKRLRDAKTEEEARDAVFAITIANDVTARDLQRADVQFTRAKSFDTFCPLGPSLVTDLDPNDLALEVRVDGKLRQQARTSAMVFRPSKFVAYVSRIVTLEAGRPAAHRHARRRRAARARSGRHRLARRRGNALVSGRRAALTVRATVEARAFVASDPRLDRAARLRRSSRDEARRRGAIARRSDIVPPTSAYAAAMSDDKDPKSPKDEALRARIDHFKSAASLFFRRAATSKPVQKVAEGMKKVEPTLSDASKKVEPALDDAAKAVDPPPKKVEQAAKGAVDRLDPALDKATKEAERVFRLGSQAEPVARQARRRNGAS